jgi:hypothetical protein
MYGLAWALMDWIPSMRGWATTILGQSMYNIPTWLCQKRKYILLTILIFGPKQPSIDIDVFLEPLMQEMKRLWRHGEPMYDPFRKEDFICRAIIFVTTNDYPVLFVLSRQIKGKMGCLVCFMVLHGCS